jgi:hypothetical protein
MQAGGQNHQPSRFTRVRESAVVSEWFPGVICRSGQGSQRQSALGQRRIQRTDTERQDAAVRLTGLFQPLDTGAEIGELGGRSTVHGDLLSEASMFLICSGSHFGPESMRCRPYPRRIGGEGYGRRCGGGGPVGPATGALW